MLKQFLKLFRGTTDPTDHVDHPHIEKVKAKEATQTYYQFVAETALPRAEERLKESSGSDPLLAFAVAVIETLFEEHWEDSRSALVDERSPRHRPPPPPITSPPPPPEESAQEHGDGSEDLEGDEETLADRDEIEAVSEVAEVAEQEEGSEVVAEGEGGDEGDLEQGIEVETAAFVESSEVDDEEESAEVASEIVETEIIEAEEFVEVVDQEVVVDDDGTSPAGFENSLDATAEFEPPPMAERTPRESSFPMKISDPAVLRGARMLMAVLTDNERLPASEQLSVAEFLMAADLWIHLIGQSGDLSSRVQNLARLVEQKFANGHFSQARLLLQLFPANSETRVNNDRQLYYEEMILRMGIRRRQTPGDGKVKRVKEALNAASLGDEKAARGVLTALSSELEAQMLLYCRQPEEVEQWRNLARLSDLPDIEHYTLGVMPPRRWRPVAAADERPLKSMLREHLVRPMAKSHIIAHLKTCYFILRAVGDTGLEPYLDSFFDWSKRFAGVDPVPFLPEIYNRTMASGEMIESIFSEIYENHYKKAVFDAMDGLSDSTLDEVYAGTMERLTEANFQDLAPGHYNLGGFLLDYYFQFDYEAPEFAFRVHRLC